MLLNDNDLIPLLTAPEPLISPAELQQVREVDKRKVISYGLSSAGYDIRLCRNEFKVFRRNYREVIDPKNFNQDAIKWIARRIAYDYNLRTPSDYWILDPHKYALGLSLETFNLPSDILGLCVGKSTYARSGLIVNTTPLEPGWQGRLVIELSNPTEVPIRVYAGEGIAQVLFFRANGPCRTSYADRAGKYQGQSGIQTAIV